MATITKKQLIDQIADATGQKRVVVKKGVDAKNLYTPLTVTCAEMFLGELNRYYVRDRTTTKPLPK